MNTILDAITKADFLASETQVENLAACVVQGYSANGTYLKVVVAHCGSEIAGKRKPSKEAQLAIVDTVHARFYAHVLVGVGPPDLDNNERNRRATFARTAASDLRAFIRRGGHLRKLDAAKVTKHDLRTWGRRVPKGTRTRAQRSFESMVAGIQRSAQRIAKRSPADARKRLEAARTAIDRLLATLAPKKTHGRPSAPARVTSARGLQRQQVTHHAPGNA